MDYILSAYGNPVERIIQQPDCKPNIRTLATSQIVTVSLESVTPEIARKWLRGNVRNRRKSQSAIDNYASAMLNGNWVPIVNDPICWGLDGALVNGQQRLEAILQSGTKQTLPVRHSPLSRDEEMYLDRGRKRTHTDVQTISNGNKEYTSSVNSLIELSFERGANLDSTERDIIFNKYKEYFTYMEMLRERLPREFKNARILSAIFLSMCNNTKYPCVRRASIESFVQVLIDSCYSREEPEGETAITFVKWYRTNAQGRGKRIYSETVNKMQVALYKYSRGRAVKKIMATEGWMYPPLPVPTSK